MPMMPSPLGVLPFVGIKLAGYTALGTYLSRRYASLPSSPNRPKTKPPGALAVGITRTIVGVLGGVAYALVLGGIGLDLSMPVVFAALAPLRFLEWALVLWLLFDHDLQHKRLLLSGSLLGTVVSYLLDIPAFGTWWLIPGIPVC